MKKITERVSYVGVNDRKTHLFEGLWPIPAGVTYNSYLVRGDSAVALIDGVEISEIGALLANIRSAGIADAPAYLVVNHMEPDHSGSIGVLCSLCPGMKIVGNAKTLEMARGFYGIPDDRMMLIADGGELDLGGVSLTFRLTPMVHWPETMMTYCPEEKVLFAGDAFGCFGALCGAVVDEDMDIEPFIPEMYRYYSNIVGKYGVPVQKALTKVSDLDIQYVCSTHGPVWHKEVARVAGIYDRLSRYEAERGVVIVYGSMYGNTERMADIIAERLAQRGIRNIRVYDASRTHISYILADIFRYNGLVIGAPTYNNSLYPPIEDLLLALKGRELKRRSVAVFGSYSWGAQAVKKISAILDECKLLDADMPTAESKHAPSPQVADQCRALADALASKI